MNQIYANNLIEKNRFMPINDEIRKAFMSLYGLDRNQIDDIETEVISKSYSYMVYDIKNKIESKGFKPKAKVVEPPIATVDMFGFGFNEPIQQTNSTTVAVEPTQTVLGTNDIHNTNEVFETALEGSEDEKFLLQTNQSSIVIPTNELIKNKGTDFRVLLALSYISNVENNTKVGNNSRYISIAKVDKNMNDICKAIDISVSQFRKHIRTLLKANSNEFKIVEKLHNDQIVKCYEMEYNNGGFVLVPIDKAEKLIVGLSNNCIKLYANLLWLCNKDGEFIERELTQSFLLELMGLSKSSDKILKIATETLEECKFIKTHKVWESETIIGADGMPKGSKPKSKIYYSIVLD